MSESSMSGSAAASPAGLAPMSAQDPDALIILLSNFPDMEAAQSAARQLVGERLASCVNLLAGVSSVYRWRGQVCEEPEVTALIKTSRGRLEATAQRLVALHPYTVPEVVALSPEQALWAYASWSAQQLQATQEQATQEQATQEQAPQEQEP